MVRKQYSIGIRPIFVLKKASVNVINNSPSVNNNALNGASSGNANVSNNPEETRKANSLLKKILCKARLYLPLEVKSLLLMLNIGF